MAFHTERRVVSGRRNVIELHAGFDFHGHGLDRALNGIENSTYLTLPRQILLAHNSDDHLELGDAAFARIPLGEIFAGRVFTLGSPPVELSYGDLVALGGDFYSRFDEHDNYTGRRISDTGKADDINGLAREPLVNAGDLKDTLSLMKDKSNRVFDAGYVRQIGEGLVASALTSSSFQYLRREEIARAQRETAAMTRQQIRYFTLALENWDHFHPYAIKRYRQLQRQAIASATKAGLALKETQLLRFASPGRKDLLDLVWSKLMLPLAKSAFACHFLTDALSSGHLYFDRKAEYYGERRRDELDDDVLPQDGVDPNYDPNHPVATRFGITVRAFEIVAGGRAIREHDERGNRGLEVVSKAHVNPATGAFVKFHIKGDGQLPSISEQLSLLDQDPKTPNQVVDLVNAVRSSLQQVVDAFCRSIKPWGASDVPALLLLPPEDYIAHASDGSCGCPRLA